MNSQLKKRDLVIIGGGAGGLVVASVAAQLGLKVTLIEKAAKLGGDCLHYGCVPSKTLIHAHMVKKLIRIEIPTFILAPNVGLTMPLYPASKETYNWMINSNRRFVFRLISYWTRLRLMGWSPLP